MEIIEPSVQNEKLSIFQKIVGVFFSPVKTMEYIAENPKVLFPVLLNIFYFPLFYLIAWPATMRYSQELFDTSMKMNPEIYKNMTADMLDNMSLFGSFGLMGGSLVLGFLAFILTTLAAFLLIKLFGGNSKFSQVLSVTGFATLITVVYYIVCAIASYFGAGLSLNASLSLLVPDMKGTVVYGILSTFSVFHIYYFIVLGIGIWKAAKFESWKATVITLIIFLVASAISFTSNMNL